MSDTTITAEERAEWRERLTSKFSCFDAELSGFTLRLLNVLEITEGMLDGSVQETRANFSAVYQACTEIIPDLKAKLAVAEARAEKAEAENARLWERLEAALDKIADIEEDSNAYTSEGVCHACGICADCPQDWQPTDGHCCRVMLDFWSSGEPLPWEAARRAVADSEVNNDRD